MIVTRLIGGLGNQMFQYAAARALGLRTGGAVYIDRRDFASYAVHAYALDVFTLDARDAAPEHLPAAGFGARLGRLLRGRRSPRHVRERGLRFDPQICALGGAVYLDGYWQCERYFADRAAEIRRDFAFRQAPSPANAAFLDRIAGETSVSLHIRRGDYVSNPQALAVHGTCPPDYYVRAVELLMRRAGCDLTAFVFSDDHDWVADHLRLPVPMVQVAGNDAAHAYEDLRLMAACRHHVIANSSFSWWGAWLDPRPDAMVVAPARWFADPARDATDILPERWIRM
ncbi:MAG: alpha-1,2-fucosyltransferase [Xanthobacteraceae bacterium]|nr:MAG: alpha-1,2-fucosyltransferase [Xanthobacteraceae bacterium]